MKKHVWFSVFLAALLIATFGIKLSIGGGLVATSSVEIAETLTEPLTEQGFQVAGISKLAGRDALLAQRNDCQMYLIPVVPHGWNQAALQKFTGPDQALWFVSNSVLTENEQERWRPLLRYFIAKVIRYMGVDFGYHPVIAIVGSKTCTPATMDWSKVPLAHFTGTSLLGE